MNFQAIPGRVMARLQRQYHAVGEMVELSRGKFKLWGSESSDCREEVAR